MPNVTVPPALQYGGTDLPIFRGEEVEIARIELASTLGDVISVRAKSAIRGIRYRVVDEYDARYSLPRRRASHLPLTMRELIRLIDKAKADETWNFARGLTDSPRDFNLEYANRPDELLDFVRVSSFYYPQLERYFEGQAQEWLRKTRERLGYDDDDEE
jgi:hypothetical protein